MPETCCLVSLLCNGLGCGHYSVISGYAGKNSSDPEWIMQDPRGYPEMEKGATATHTLGRNVRVRQAAFHQRWQADGPKDWLGDSGQRVSSN